MTDIDPVSPAAEPEEESAALRRRRAQTLPALVGALIATLGIVAFLVFIVVRPDGMRPSTVDWHAVAAESGDPRLVDPKLPEGWSANTARLEQRDGAETWQIGFLTPSGEYIAMKQGFAPDAAWIDAQLDGVAPSGPSIDAGGLEWDVVDRRDERDTGNHAFALVAEASASSVVVLHGTASDEEFLVLAESIGAEATRE